MGQGAYGVVCAATDEVSGKHCALKKIESAFEHITFTKRTLRELRILRNMNHENVIGIESLFLPEDRKSFEDIYVVQELMETDLTSILKSSQPLTDEHCQFFLYQILRGLKYVHSAGVIHRDLKPRNLLVNANCDLKICDFGLARVHFNEKEWTNAPMTEYVCTRWYRAPEVLCCWEWYDFAIDVWSVGCIFAEMLGRKPVFPGSNTQNQLQIICEQVGKPSHSELAKITNEKCKQFIVSLQNCRPNSFSSKYPSAPRDAIDLLDSMLKFSGRSRCLLDDALAHPYLKLLSCPSDEPTRARLSCLDFEFDRRQVTVDALRDELYTEMLTYWPELQSEYLKTHTLRDITSYRLLKPGETQYDDA
jgi:mitogen-activated protein kinase 1/3/mitogen-activated protein kinase 6